MIRFLIIIAILSSTLFSYFVFIDVSSDERMETSIESIKENLPLEKQEAFTEALLLVGLNGIDIFNTNEEEMIATMKRNLAWKSAEQIFREAEIIRNNRNIEKKQKKDKENANPINRLEEIRNWYVKEIWNNGIIDFSWYISGGTSSTGEEIDIDFSLRSFNKEIEKLYEYNEYIRGLSEKYYEDIKYTWDKTYVEILKINEWIKKNGIIPNYKGKKFSTGLLRQYMDGFEKAINELKDRR